MIIYASIFENVRMYPICIYQHNYKVEWVCKYMYNNRLIFIGCCFISPNTPKIRKFYL